MPKFLLEASLTAQGVKGVRSEGGTARREAVQMALQSVGGQLEAFYFASRGTRSFASDSRPVGASSFATTCATPAAR
jgi:uncharacterized protein with GYD domain